MPNNYLSQYKKSFIQEIIVPFEEKRLPMDLQDSINEFVQKMNHSIQSESCINVAIIEEQHKTLHNVFGALHLYNQDVAKNVKLNFECFNIQGLNSENLKRYKKRFSERHFDLIIVCIGGYYSIGKNKYELCDHKMIKEFIENYTNIIYIANNQYSFWHYHLDAISKLKNEVLFYIDLEIHGYKSKSIKEFYKYLECFYTSKISEVKHHKAIRMIDALRSDDEIESFLEKQIVKISIKREVLLESKEECKELKTSEKYKKYNILIVDVQDKDEFMRKLTSNFRKNSNNNYFWICNEQNICFDILFIKKDEKEKYLKNDYKNSTRKDHLILVYYEELEWIAVSNNIDYRNIGEIITTNPQEDSSKSNNWFLSKLKLVWESICKGFIEVLKYINLISRDEITTSSQNVSNSKDLISKWHPFTTYADTFFHVDNIFILRNFILAKFYKKRIRSNSLAITLRDKEQLGIDCNNRNYANRGYLYVDKNGKICLNEQPKQRASWEI